jgi:hypothetical protein
MLTDADRQTFGDDLIGFSRRAALEALGPEVRQLQQQNAHLQARLRQQTRRDLEQDLDRSVPGWRQLHSDPQWLAWLERPDDYSGQSRRVLINQAADRGDAARVAAFFQHPPVGHQAPAHQPRAAQSRSPQASSGAILTRPQIAALYERRRKGEFNDDHWAQIEPAIFSAANQGRIAGALDRDGNRLSELR